MQVTAPARGACERSQAMTRHTTRTLFTKLLRLVPLIGVSVSILAFSTAAGAQGEAAHSQRGSKTILACKERTGGGLYIAHRCHGRDTRVVWNAVGPQGSAGA